MGNVLTILGNGYAKRQIRDYSKNKPLHIRRIAEACRISSSN